MDCISFYPSNCSNITSFPGFLGLSKSYLWIAEEQYPCIRKGIPIAGHSLPFAYSGFNI